MPRKILIDTDPGIDDAMAIFYALNSPELEVIGLTTVFGNAQTDICTINALRLLEIAQRTDIPVAAGSHRPWVGSFYGGADFVHGADGQGNVVLAMPQAQPVPQHAAHFIIEQVMQAPQEITLVALAPLTNVALALTLEPKLAQNIKEIVLMGGNAFVVGNVTPAAEANIWNDPEAADIVFGAECPITMIGLDVTEKVYASPAQLNTIQNFQNPQAQHIAQILGFYRQFYQSRFGEDGIFIHDSTTITYLLEPSLFKFAHHPIRVETQGMSRGKTWAALGRSDFEREWEGRQKIQIAVEVDAPKAIELELARLAY